MRRVLEETSNLHLRQGLVVELIVVNNQVAGLEMQDGRRLGAKSIVVATGTFLNGTIHTGQRTFSAGRAGEPASIELAESLRNLGFPVGRLKTGTPPRLDGRTIDWDCFEPQYADKNPVAFSFATERIEQKQIKCFIGYTTDILHNKIRSNLHQSPLYSGKIKGIGPRYCPSIEDKVVKFADKDRHQLFLEPEGLNTNEVYLNGFSTSLPAELQKDLLQLIPGFENVKIIRPGYAIEYDYVDPKQLKHTMETSKVKGLFFAGQINGTTGYEEAACQGLMAGINAALQVQNRNPFVLSRNESYIGVLTDDLIQHGVDEPYRIFTSRAEARLLLRHDNADRRLAPKGKELGLVGDSVWGKFNQKRDMISLLRSTLENTKIKNSSVEYASISKLLNTTFTDSISLSQLSLRQGVNSEIVFNLLPKDIQLQTKLTDLETTLADLLYEGYINNHQAATERTFHNDNLRVPDNFAFNNINGLSNEMVERLARANPQSFGQIRKIPGLTPSALSAVLVYLSSSKV
jgi:tRNA uridine 5-carboxymethylaminomethyl modification enzyme